MRVDTLRIFMKQRAVIRFLTFKGLHASAVAAELKSVCETEALTLFYSEELGQTLCGRENFDLQRPKVRKTSSQRLSRRHFLCVEGEAIPFMQGYLQAFPHCKWDLLANFS
jgi:hypothetical protein